MEKEKLFQEFPSTSTGDWKEKIVKDLKGADYEKKLVWRTPEGFNAQPFYRSEDLEKNTNLDVYPGDYPFLRGNNVKGNEWLVRESIIVDDDEISNKKALDIRMKGVDSIGFVFNKNNNPTEDNIELLLKNIRLDVMELNYDSGNPKEVITAVDSLAKKYNRDLDKVRGSVNYDPIADGKKLEGIEELFNAANHLPKFHVLTVDGSVFHNSGSGIVTQLAFTLAKGADYLSHLSENGFEVDEVAPKMRFHFAVGSSYFMEIAKFRAARYLWANIVNAYGLNNAKNASMFIHCSNSTWNKTAYDPYVNMLRTTTETMSATTGGVDSMTVLPFNEVFETPTEFSERIARNQQLLLKGESYFNKVNDPGAGSYYIEELTEQIIQQAWKLFLEVDSLGGYQKAFDKGFIQERVKTEAEEKNEAIANRKRSLLGTNQFPNISESLDHLPEVAETDPALINPYRGAQAFEQLRFKTDQFSKTNKRPKAWMFTFGKLAMRNARAQFAANFFGCAGFEIVNNPGFKTIEDGIEATKKAKPEIVVICSSDAEYENNVEIISEALKHDTVVVLAGYPKELVEKLKARGFENFVHVKTNVLAELTRYQQMLNIG